MKSTVESLEPTRVKVTVEADYDELKPDMDKAYREIAQQVSIPGFRKGHVPPRIIDQRFGRGVVIEQVVNEVLPGLYSRAVMDNELRPVSQPDVDVVEVPAAEGEPGGLLKFTAEVDVVPAFDVPEFEGLEVEVSPVEVDDEAVQAELDELRGRFATLKNLERAAEDGDYLTLDLEAKVGDEVIDTLSEVSYELGSGNMLEGQDEALRGQEAGAEVTFTSTVRGGEYAGQDATIEVKVISVKERELPEADDDFAQMVSEFDTAEELLADLREQVARRGVSRQALEARDKLLAQLLEQTEILLPESAIEHELSHRVDENTSDEDKQSIREAVENDLRQSIFLETLAEKSDVQVGQQELFEFMMQTAQTFGMDPGQLFQDQRQIQNMMVELARTKALVAVLRGATVKDTNGELVDISEFTADPAEAEAPSFEEQIEEVTEEVAEEAKED
ncbi:trigger factor [Actinomyces sp. F1_1611]